MKYKYYYINPQGVKILARTSTNDYKYALVYKNAVDNKGTLKCSAKFDAVQKEFNYLTKGWGYDYKDKVDGKYLYSSQFHNPLDLSIVLLIKEEK